MNTKFPPFWRQRLLAVVGAPRKTENLRLLEAWAEAEGGPATWNPLNTSYKLPNSTTLSGNTSGVQNYKRPTEGVCATALTLVNGLYGGILGDLQAGTKDAVQIVNDRSDEFRTWGSDPALIADLLQ